MVYISQNFIIISIKNRARPFAWGSKPVMNHAGNPYSFNFTTPHVRLLVGCLLKGSVGRSAIIYKKSAVKLHSITIGAIV